MTSTGQIIGPTGDIPAGPAFVSIGEIVGGAAQSVFEIGARDIAGTVKLDTFELGNGVPFNEFFPNGVDSLNLLTLGGGARFSVGTTN